MEKQIEIVNTARSLFTQFGLKKVTIADISKASGVSKATIYKYFSNKQEIFNKVVSLESEILLTAIKEAVAKENTTQNKFKAHLMTKMAKINELINFYKVTNNDSNDHWPFIAEARENFYNGEKKIIVDILTRGINLGELQDCDTELVAHMMIISLRSQEYEWAIKEHNITLEDYINLMIDVMIHGISKRVEALNE